MKNSLYILIGIIVMFILALLWRLEESFIQERERKEVINGPYYGEGIKDTDHVLEAGGSANPDPISTK